MSYLKSLIPFLILLSACQPTVYQVVTTTPVPVTQTPFVVVVTATPIDTGRATQASTPVLSTLAPVVTPTQEIGFKPHKACALTNPTWDDEFTGCAVNTNPLFNRGFAVQTVGNVSVFVPKSWTLYTGASMFPVTCITSACTANVQWTSPQAVVGYQQVLSGIEKDTCYIVKSTWQYHVRNAAGNWSAGILFAGSRANGAEWNWQEFPLPANAPDKNGFHDGVFESVTPYLGKDLVTPSIGVALKSQWGVWQGDSTVTLSGAFVFAAPDGFCSSSSTLTY